MSPHPEITINLAEPKEVFLPNNNYDHSRSTTRTALKTQMTRSPAQAGCLPINIAIPGSATSSPSSSPLPSPGEHNHQQHHKHHHRAQAQTLSSFARFSSQTTVLKPRKHSLMNLCCLMMFFLQECLRRSTLLLVELEADE